MIDVIYYVNILLFFVDFSAMKAQEKDEKAGIKLQYATALHKALKDSAIKSFRQLAKNAGMEPAHVQRISTGQLDVGITTTIALVQALNLTLTEFGFYFDSVTEKEISEFKKLLEQQKKRKGR